MNKKNLIIALLLAVVLGVSGVWYFIFYRPRLPRDITNEDAVSVTSKQIVKEFQTNEAEAYKKYPTSKVVEITGEIAECGKDQSGHPTVSIKSDDPFSNVFITLRQSKQLEAKVGTKITVRGIVTGFLSDVLINEGVVTKQ